MRREAPVLLIGLVVKGLSRNRLELTRRLGPVLRGFVGLRHVARTETQVDEATQFRGSQIQHIRVAPAAMQLGLAEHPAPETHHLLLDLQDNAAGEGFAKIETSRQSHSTLLN